MFEQSAILVFMSAGYFKVKSRLLGSLFGATALVLSGTAVAHDYSGPRFFFSHESSGEDTITSIGTGITIVNSESNLGFQLNTSIANAEVLSDDGYIEDYFAWEGSVKVGLFSNISIYGEAGIDLSELLFDDYRHDRHDYYYTRYSDDIDAYLGFGAGVQLGPLKVEAYSRVREIDSLYWEAQSENFSGVQFSLNF